MIKMINSKTWIVVSIIIVGFAAGSILLFGRPSEPRNTTSPSGITREFTLNAQNWEFTPSQIEVDLGDKVVLEIKGIDDGAGRGHGFSILKFGINKVVRKDETVMVEFVADEKGTFSFSCSVPCGSGHSTMRGTLQVN